MMKSVALAVILIVVSLGAQAQNLEKNDTSNAAIRTCEYPALPEQLGELSGVSHLDQTQICKEMRIGMGRMPSVRLVRAMGKVFFVMRVVGAKEAAKDVTYQFMNVVEARRQTTDEQVYETLDTLARIYDGSNGRVTAKDMNLRLRAMGARASKLDQQGMFYLAAVIQSQNKETGR